MKNKYSGFTLCLGIGYNTFGEFSRKQVENVVYYYRTDDRIIHEEEEISMGVWVNMVNPTMTEGEEIARKLDIDLQDLLAALDEEESSVLSWKMAIL